MIPTYFQSYPEESSDVNASNALAAMIDGLGFRLFHAVNNLNASDLEYRICEGAMTTGEILNHIHGLINWVHNNVFGEGMDNNDDLIAQSHLTLSGLEKLRKHFVDIDDATLATYKLDKRNFWAFMYMPLSDATHHAGQISILRRASGNPIVR